MVLMAVQSECDPKVANVVNSEYGHNSAHQMWTNFGKNVARSRMANRSVNQMWSTYVSANVDHVHSNVSGPVLAKIWHSEHWLMWL